MNNYNRHVYIILARKHIKPSIPYNERQNLLFQIKMTTFDHLFILNENDIRTKMSMYTIAALWYHFPFVLVFYLHTNNNTECGITLMDALIMDSYAWHGLLWGKVRHHGVHSFFILQRGIKAAVGIDTKLKIYMYYINDNERQPNGNNDNNKNDSWTQRWTKSSHCCHSFANDNKKKITKKNSNVPK